MLANELQPGDIVRVSRLVTVRNIDKEGFFSADGHYYFDNSAVDESTTTWTIDMVQRTKPEFWPPQEGDVWFSELGEYHIIRRLVGNSRLVAIRADDSPTWISLDSLKTRPGLKLEYRRK